MLLSGLPRQLDSNTICLGSSSRDALVRIDGADAVHAEITSRRVGFGDPEWWISDRDSSSGTLLNGERLERPTCLCNGDRITIADVDILFSGGWLREDHSKAHGVKVCIQGVSDERNGKVILRSVDASVNDGEFVGILGPSGCGKSSVIQRIAGLAPFNGHISINGHSVGEDDLRRLIAYLPQNVENALHDGLTVREEMDCNRRLYLAPTADDVKLDADYLDTLGLAAEVDKPIGRQDSVMLGNSAYFSSVVTSARENALANIAECQKLGIPCVMPIICFQCAESRRDTGAVGDDAEENRFSVLENYLDASIGAKALGLCFKGRKPELNAKGYCSKEVIWDAGTSSVTVRYLGVDGEPILRGAFSGYWQQYDSAGGVKCTSWLDKRGYGIRYRLTNEYFTVEYNDIGNRTRKTYCDPSWRPTPKDDGVLFETFGYDADGNETDRAFFNASSNSAVCADGIASIKRRYNARRQEVWRRFYGANGEPAVHRDGNAGFDCVYDKWGNLRRMTAVDTQGNPVMTRHGFAREERKYNAQNQVTEDAWYDEKGRLVCVNGSAKIVASYDDKRNKVSEEYYGADNRLARNDHNYAVAQWTYNAAGEAIECRYYGPDGEPTVDENGIASWRVVYDAAGRNAGRRYYDLNGNEIDAQEKVPAPAME